MTRNLQVNLAVSGTVYDLMTLILALAQIVTETAAQAFFPNQVAALSIQASGGIITLVDSHLDTMVGLTIADGATHQVGPFDGNYIGLTDFKLKGSAVDTKANIQITVK